MPAGSLPCAHAAGGRHGASTTAMTAASFNISAPHRCEGAGNVKFEEAHIALFAAQPMAVGRRKMHSLAAREHLVLAVHGETHLAGEHDEHAFRVRVHVH